MCRDKIFEEFVNCVKFHKIKDSNIDSEIKKYSQCIEKLPFCEDRVVAIIEKNLGNIKFKNNFFNRKKKVDSIFHNKFSTIVIILESPHKSEYQELLSKKFGGVFAALGDTGKNIEKWILGCLAKYCYFNDFHKNGIYLLSTPRLENGLYNLVLINAIQLPCSMLKKLDTNTKKIRDDIFKKMFESDFVKKNLIGRIKRCNPIMIINCCTNGDSSISLKLEVQKLLNENFNCKKLQGHHPSSPFFLEGFREVE